MADKELRRLKRRELLQMLLVQCQETERLQQESNEMKEQLEAFMESYERLKKKLDIKDERLNQKDARIAELSREIEGLKEVKHLGVEDSSSIVEATLRLSGVFEEAQRAAEQYLLNVKKMKERAAAKSKPQVIQQPALAGRIEKKQYPFGMERTAGMRKRTGTARSGQVVPMPGQAGGFERGMAKDADVGAFITAAASGDIYG